jgi:hypothetical protein
MTIALLRRLTWLALPFIIAAGPTGIAACGDSTAPGGGCCKVCTKGKACGDTCIEATKTCHVGRGCACNG